MSKLPHAPLIEVIFELKWPVSEAKELQDIQYLHGDIYPLIKEDFPYREPLPNFPIEFSINRPTHRFRTAKNDYPLVQVGPGILTVNTIDPKYYWETYEKQILNVLEKFQTVYSFGVHQKVNLVLQYIDLLRFDFEKGDIIKYLEENLNISIKQNFYHGNSVAGGFGLAVSYRTDLGQLNVSVGRGKHASGYDGISIQTNITSAAMKPDNKEIARWLNSSHEFCSSLFKDMTKGKLYDSFK